MVAQEIMIIMRVAQSHYEVVGIFICLDLLRVALTN